LSDTSNRPFGRSSAGPHQLAIKAVFVPDGGQPPALFLESPFPFYFPATLDPKTGTFSTDMTGNFVHGEVSGQWISDDDADG